mgnify:CR=1 FL=1
MTLTPLTAISPVDGRYRRATEPLADYFSEGALIRYRVSVEIAYFIALCELPLPPLAGVATGRFEDLRAIYRDFQLADAEAVKRIERETNHDVKAVEYFLKEQFDALGLDAAKEFIHFGLTSQDINNTAMPLSLKEGWHQVMLPMLEAVVRLAREYELPVQVSLEEFMACAVGGCAGCAVQLETPEGTAMKRVCVDGPVFDATQVFP